MKCDSRAIGCKHSEEFDEVTTDLNEFKLEEIMKHLNKLLPLITYDRAQSFGMVLF